MEIYSNKLGHLTAEHDLDMLRKAFYESPDYRTLVESNDKVIVIGRRGTGKSALTYKLEDTWKAGAKTWVYKFTPSEDQVIGIKPLLRTFGESYELIKAATRICWETSIYLELLYSFSRHYKFNKCESCNEGQRIVRENYKQGKNIAFTVRQLLKKCLTIDPNPETVIAEMCEILEVDNIKECVESFCRETNIFIKILIDCLDEGYNPDTLGIAHTSGILQAVLNINAAHKNIRPIVFIRDNMFRAVSKYDPDYTRNMEGASLRLHWGENELTHMIAFRLKLAFSIDAEKDLKVWSQCTIGPLQNRDGFRACLRMTLYRPRDIIALLNQAFYLASREHRSRISEDDVANTSREISQARLDDLKKEYEVIFPSIDDVIGIFNGKLSTFKPKELEGEIFALMESKNTATKTRREMAFYDNPSELLSALYSIGFLGIKDLATGVFSFSHDGKSVNIDINEETEFHIHPCYQKALSLALHGYSIQEAEEIHDDYEIRVESLSREQRNKKIGQLISRVRDIDLGRDDANEFEQWCLDCIRTIFPTELDNIRLNPNKDAPQRRDVVATISAREGVWRRIYEDYKTRAIIFEIKNYEVLKPDNFRQMASYLIDVYGSFGFIVYRKERKEPSSENELTWIREIYWKQDGHNKLIVLLSYKHLINFLEKIRNPEKYNAVDKILNRIIDDYHQRYLNEPSGRKRKD
jgi:hypothetical protein